MTVVTPDPRQETSSHGEHARPASYRVWQVRVDLAEQVPNRVGRRLDPFPRLVAVEHKVKLVARVADVQLQQRIGQLIERPLKPLGGLTPLLLTRERWSSRAGRRTVHTAATNPPSTASTEPTNAPRAPCRRLCQSVSSSTSPAAYRTERKTTDLAPGGPPLARGPKAGRWQSNAPLIGLTSQRRRSQVGGGPALSPVGEQDRPAILPCPTPAYITSLAPP
jgi:hypothetical protein